jgi:Raf kinase inhibitor-like YbhB/YbcL family protein
MRNERNEKTVHAPRSRRLVGVAAVAGVVASALAPATVGCTPPAPIGPSAPRGASLQRLAVTSRSFESNGAIPVDYTCDGADRSPQLTWSAPPSGTKSFAILVTDPDAAGGEFVHWVAYGIRADATSIPEATDAAELGGLSGTNGFNRTGYSGPCPPKMELHTYAFRVYALDAVLAPRSSESGDDLLNDMNGHVLAEGMLVGRFSH